MQKDELLRVRRMLRVLMKRQLLVIITKSMSLMLIVFFDQNLFTLKVVAYNIYLFQNFQPMYITDQD